jgi:4-amino-4-deoxy-L-arabinose transferase-like glycosyltransferase
MPKNNVKNLILITIISFVLISSNIGGLYIYSLDEAKNSVCAREMLDRGDLIVPTFNQELRTDKPPLHYYFMQLAYLIFGVNEFSARFFSVIMGIITLLTTWWLANRYLGARAALYAMLVLISSLHFDLQFHMAVPDPYLIFLLTVGLAAFYVFYREEKTGYLLISYIAFGLGTLTKGPVAIALPGLSILIFLLINKKFSWEYMLKLKPFWILGVLMIVVIPWYVLVSLKTNGDWTRDFFFYHNLGRYTSTMEGHGAIFLITPLIVIIGLLPFSIFLIQSFRWTWQKRRENHLLLYSLVYILTIVAFFSISKTKLPNYTVPAYPFLAILLGNYLARLHESLKQDQKSSILTLIFYCIIISIIPFILFYGLRMDPELSSLDHLAFYFAILPLGGLLGLFFSSNGNFKGMLISLSLSWIIVILLFFYIIFPQVDQKNPVARTIGSIDKNLPVAAYKIYNPSFSFYIPKHFTRLETKTGVQEYIRNNRGYIITRKSLADEINNLSQLRKIGEAKDIFEIPTTVIYQIDHELPSGKN